MTLSADSSTQTKSSPAVNSTPASSPPDLTIVIPALNEQENLELLLPLIADSVKELQLNAELLVIDGGSQDQSRAVAQRFGARVIAQSERGYGGALIAGFAAANGPYVVTMDADLSHPPRFLKDFWEQRSKAQLLVASRYVAGGKADMGMGRRVLSIILNRTYALVLGIKLRDLSSGFRMYEREVLDKLGLRARDFDVLE